jgi:hypothetical protein
VELGAYEDCWNMFDAAFGFFSLALILTSDISAGAN